MPDQGGAPPCGGAVPGVFDQVDALPCAERWASAGDRDRQRNAGQDCLQVRRHVVRPFVVMGIARILRGQLVEPAHHVATHFGRGIFPMHSEAEVCRQNTVSSPVSIPCAATQPATWGVIS
jgi:hypothetical protein